MSNQDQVIRLLYPPTQGHSIAPHLTDRQPISHQTNMSLEVLNIYQTYTPNCPGRHCLSSDNFLTQPRICNIQGSVYFDLVLDWYSDLCPVSSVYSNYDSNFINFVTGLAPARHNQGVIQVWCLLGKLATKIRKMNKIQSDQPH